jgi:hypothetical protein
VHAATSRQPRSTWIGRFLRGRVPDRNPLRRRTDRVETAILASLLAVMCATAPFLAAAASGAENATSLRELHVQQATCHQVKATLLDDAQDTGGYPFVIAEAHLRWTIPDGRIITELLRVPVGSQAGTVISMWVDQSGQPITPLLRTQIPERDDFAAMAAVAGLGAVLLAAGLAVRRTLNRRRMSAWAVDWMVTEPRWNTRR